MSGLTNTQKTYWIQWLQTKINRLIDIENYNNGNVLDAAKQEARVELLASKGLYSDYINAQALRGKARELEILKDNANIEARNLESKIADTLRKGADWYHGIEGMIDEQSASLCTKCLRGKPGGDKIADLIELRETTEERLMFATSNAGLKLAIAEIAAKLNIELPG